MDIKAIFVVLGAQTIQMEKFQGTKTSFWFEIDQDLFYANRSGHHYLFLLFGGPKKYLIFMEMRLNNWLNGGGDVIIILNLKCR